MMSAGSLNAVWNYRGFILGSVRRDYQLRYRGTMLGMAWTMAQPLAMILIYTLVFSTLMKTRLPGVEGDFAYSIHLCAGIIAWSLFAEIIQRSQLVFIENANLLKKQNFPRLALPIVVVATALLNFSILFGLFLLFLLLTGNFPGWVLLNLLPLLLVQVLFASGLGVTLGVLHVFFRDIGPVTALMLQFWFWATPIVYPASILPSSVSRWVVLNPMVPLVQSYQNILASHIAPQWDKLAWVGGLSLLLVLNAIQLFQRRCGEMLDEL